MPNFDYEAPTSLKTALGFLSGNGEIRPLAGGTDVIDQLKIPHKAHWTSRAP